MNRSTAGALRLGAHAAALSGALFLLTACAGQGPAAPTPAPIASLATEVDCLAPNSAGDSLPKRAPDDGVTELPGTEPSQFAEPGTTAEPSETAEPTSTTHPDAPEPGRVPAGFVPTAAYLCTVEYTFAPVDGSSEGSATVIVEKRTGDFGPLVKALAKPDQQPSADQVCTADMEIVPDLWLEDASGAAMRAAWPWDACGKTLPATHAAFAELTLVSRTVLPVP
jgi:hypothetical protein